MPTNALHEAFQAALPPSVAGVNALIASDPESLMEKNDKYEMTPLFWALWRGIISTNVVQALIDACPDAILERDGDGDLPIQESVRSHQFEIALALIHANPAGLELQDSRGELPLHLAAAVDVDLETFNLILQGYPEACKVKDSKGNIPLQLALFANDPDFAVIEALVRAFPDSLKIEGSSYPFHEICYNYPSDMTEEFILFVNDNCPEVFLLPHGNGQLPLHAAFGAINSDTQPQTAALAIIRACPEAARVPEDKGLLPLHIAVSSTSASMEAVHALYGAWPDSLNQSDNKGRIPLALAVECGAPQAVVELLLRACPESAKSKDHQGMTPLHHAYRSSVGTAAVLIEAWPDGLKEPDTLGNIPLLLAMFESTYFNNNVATLLLEAWPDSIRRSNTDGNLVIHEFSRKIASGEFLTSASDAVARARFMIDAWPESLLHRNREGQIPLHVLLGHMVKVYRITGRKRRREDHVNHQLQIVSLFVENCRESVEVADADGNIPLIIACKKDAVPLDVVQFLTKASLNVLLSNRRRRTASLTEES